MKYPLAVQPKGIIFVAKSFAAASEEAFAASWDEAFLGIGRGLCSKLE
ncbi:MAG: hypothetical protein K6C30_07830 [Bacteroidaceae bacterium]|nr:hypothetical protein [Bacteroidaceae bacterium]